MQCPLDSNLLPPTVLHQSNQLWDSLFGHPEMTNVSRLMRCEYEGDNIKFDSDDEHETDSESLDHSAATEPLEEGPQLLASGEFGRIGVKRRVEHRNLNVVKTILRQRSRAIPVYLKEDIHSVRVVLFLADVRLFRIFQNLVPNTNGTIVANYNSRIYSALLSKGISSSG